MIRIMVVDDHALVREALGRLLEGAHDLRVVGSFDEAAAAVDFAGRDEPDVAILVVAAVDAVHAGEDPLERLSARELEVLKLVVEGNTSHQMATMLGLSPKSIDTYRSRLMAKLDIHHLPALVKFAIRRGLTSA